MEHFVHPSSSVYEEVDIGKGTQNALFRDATLPHAIRNRTRCPSCGGEYLQDDGNLKAVNEPVTKYPC